MKKSNLILSGIVVHGAGRGKQLGFPTANILYDAEMPVDYGIYASWVIVRGMRYAAATSVGVNEMFDATAPTIEAHLLGFSGDIVGENIKIEFVKRLRKMKKFNSVEALKKQIKYDIKKVRKLLSQ